MKKLLILFAITIMGCTHNTGVGDGHIMVIQTKEIKDIYVSPTCCKGMAKFEVWCVTDGSSFWHRAGKWKMRFTFRDSAHSYDVGDTIYFCK